MVGTLSLLPLAVMVGTSNKPPHRVATRTTNSHQLLGLSLFHRSRCSLFMAAVCCTGLFNHVSVCVCVCICTYMHALACGYYLLPYYLPCAHIRIQSHWFVYVFIIIIYVNKNRLLCCTARKFSAECILLYCLTEFKCLQCGLLQPAIAVQDRAILAFSK